jgi:hypothetical protein
MVSPPQEMLAFDEIFVPQEEAFQELLLSNPSAFVTAVPKGWILAEESMSSFIT